MLVWIPEAAEAELGAECELASLLSRASSARQEAEAAAREEKQVLE